MTQLELRRGASFTVEDLEAFESDGHRYELYDGALVVTPSPALLHQLVTSNLFGRLHAAAPAHYRVLTAPLDWRAGPASMFEPDLLVIERSTIDVAAKRLESPPILAIEILSASTRSFDLGAKRLAYATAGLQHYWIVDPDEPSITLLTLDSAGREYVEVGRAVGNEGVSAETPFAVTLRPRDLVTP
jgi:Uma2 family endonuclease